MRIQTDMSTPTADPFQTNHAYQRLIAVGGRHMHAVSRSGDGWPVVLTLYDLATGDAVTIALLNSIQASRAHALLVRHRDGALSDHGPFDGENAAAATAPALALTDRTVAATLPLPLHHPTSGDLPPDDAWRPLHQTTASGTVAAPAQPVQAALVLIDQPRQRLAVVGPFPDHAAATRWQPADPDPDVDRVIVPMHLDVAADISGMDGGGRD